MIEVSILGSGNIAQHLIAAFSNNPNIWLKQVFARNPNKLAHYISADKLTDDISKLVDADLFIIAVSDHAIVEVASQLPFGNKLVAHTAGSVPLEALGKNNRAASFYPLQTFSKDKAVNWQQIPICLEAQNKSDLAVLYKLATALSGHVIEVDSNSRLALHTAAVFVCNFVNHLYACGANICRENQLDFNLLHPLIIETADKIRSMTPEAAQTGPASRGDEVTVKKHLNFLDKRPEKKLYEILTEAIQEKL